LYKKSLELKSLELKKQKQLIEIFYNLTSINVATVYNSFSSFWF